jgi:hypothetical protein
VSNILSTAKGYKSAGGCEGLVMLSNGYQAQCLQTVLGMGHQYLHTVLPVLKRLNLVWDTSTCILYFQYLKTNLGMGQTKLGMGQTKLGMGHQYFQTVLGMGHQYLQTVLPVLQD